MGKVMIVYRIYPKEGHDLNLLERDLKAINKVKEVRREQIAFGIEMFKIGVLIDDKTDKPQEVEDTIRNVAGVKEIETLDISLIS